MKSRVRCLLSLSLCILSLIIVYMFSVKAAEASTDNTNSRIVKDAKKTDENGQYIIYNGKPIWEKVPFYKVEDKLPIEHAAKSQYILSSFMKLSRDESISILSHMGGFDNAVKGGSYTMGEAFKQHPLALYTHIADMKASNIDERDMQ